MNITHWLSFAQRLHTLSETGLAFSTDDYDREHYQEIKAIGLDMLANRAKVPTEKIIELIPSEIGNQAPKVDVRAVVLNQTG